MKPFDPYKVLGVPRDADAPTVRKAKATPAKPRWRIYLELTS